MSTLISLIAFPVSAAVIAAVLRSPLAGHFVAAPREDRWHERPTPLIGGFGIFAGFVAGVGAALAIGAAPASRELLAIVGGAAILFAAGLLDDLRPIPPLAQLGAQLVAVAVVLASGVHVEIVADDRFALPLAVLWLVGMTNAFNFLDNMDGLAATLAAIALAFFAIDAAHVHDNPLVLALALAAGAAYVARAGKVILRGS